MLAEVLILGTRLDGAVLQTPSSNQRLAFRSAFTSLTRLRAAAVGLLHRAEH